MDVLVEFSPTIVGNYQSPYNINGSYNDGITGIKYWYDLGMLQGDGVYFEPPPTEETQAILDFIDEKAASEELVGEGPGSSANNRLNALRNMIEAAGETTFGINLSDRPLYTGAGRQSEPRISGDSVIFTDLGTGYADIFVGDVNTGGFTNITNTPYRNEKLNDIDGNLAVFTDIDGSGGGDIIVLDVTVPTVPLLRTSIATPAREMRPRIGGDYVVYQLFNGADNDIWVRELSTGNTFSIVSDEGDQIDPSVSNGKVVFTDLADGMVKYFDIDTLTLHNIDSGSGPDIDGNRIVYSRDVGNGNYDVFLYDIGSGNPPKNITNRTGTQWEPSILGNYIAYDDDSSGNWNVYLYLINENLTVQVTSDLSNQKLADVGNGYVVYEDDCNLATTGTDIYVTDFSITTNQEACEQLSDALKKCDGEPEDFVVGSAREELYNMIEDLMISIGCD